MLGLEWIPAFEIIKTCAMALKIVYTFCNNAISAKTVCAWRTLYVFAENNFFPLKYSFSPKNDLEKSSLAKERW